MNDIKDQSPPDPIRTSDILKTVWSEFIHGATTDRFKSAASASQKRRQQRIELLLRRTYTVGPITVPVPQQAAYYQILTLRDQLAVDTATDPLILQQWVMESIWMLHVQENLDQYFLAGIDRTRAIQAFWANIPAHEFGAYYMALIDLLVFLEKKSENYSATMTKHLQTLMKQFTSSSSPKPSPGPSPTSPDPGPTA